MTIEDAIERCSLGELRIHVRTAEEKQALLDLCHSMGYETGRCSADSYEEFSFLKIRPNRNFDFSKVAADCPYVEHFQLCSASKISVSDLL